MNGMPVLSRVIPYSIKFESEFQFFHGRGGTNFARCSCSFALTVRGGNIKKLLIYYLSASMLGIHRPGRLDKQPETGA